VVAGRHAGLGLDEGVVCDVKGDHPDRRQEDGPLAATCDDAGSPARRAE
jgi:hypothetical protein